MLFRSSIVALEFDKISFAGADRLRVKLCIEVEPERGPERLRGQTIAASRALLAGGGTHRTFVRIGNAAYAQVQHDLMGEMLLCLETLFTDPRVVLGDCNATRWTQAFREMLAASGLVDTADGAGWQPTWPVSLPALLRIPIDHVLVEPTLQVRRRWIGPETGSDHLPVYVEFDLPR